ncbi:unnamed protein product [Arctogadus glacialis]
MQERGDGEGLGMGRGALLAAAGADDGRNASPVKRRRGNVVDGMCSPPQSRQGDGVRNKTLGQEWVWAGYNSLAGVVWTPRGEALPPGRAARVVRSDHCWAGLLPPQGNTRLKVNGKTTGVALFTAQSTLFGPPSLPFSPLTPLHPPPSPFAPPSIPSPPPMKGRQCSWTSGGQGAGPTGSEERASLDLERAAPRDGRPRSRNLLDSPDLSRPLWSGPVDGPPHGQALKHWEAA